MRSARQLPIVVVLALAAAACSGGDNAQSSSSDVGSAVTSVAPTTAAPTTVAPTTVPATTAPPTTAPATTQPATTAPATTAPATTAPADPQAAIAATALLTLDDFAEGWTEGPRDQNSDEEDATNIGRIADCAGADADLIGKQVMGTTRAESQEFSTGDGTFTVRHSVGFAADADTAAAAIAEIGDPDLPGCYGIVLVQLFEEELANPDPDPANSLPPGLEVGDVTTTVGDLSAFGLQADAHWFHLAYPLTLDGQTFEQHGDFVFLRNGAALSQVFLTGFAATFPADDLQQIVQLADARLAEIA